MSKELKKICLIIPSNKAGGMERVMCSLANYFVSKKNIRVFFVTYSNVPGFFNINNDIKVYSPSFNLYNHNKFTYSIRLLFFLRSLLVKLNPDVVLSFGEMYNSFVLLATFGLKVGVYVSDRSKPDKKWGLFHETLRKIIYKTAKGIVSQTEYSKMYLHKITKHSNIELIPNPVSITPSNNVERENVILNVGRLISSKKIDVLINIFSKIKYKNWELWIVGDGPERNNLENLVSELNLINKVKFWGTQRGIGYFYEKASVFAFTSVSEGFPNSLIEAISFGLPCISFDCIAGPSDIIINEVNGYLIPEMDINLFSEKLEKLILDNDLRHVFSKNALSISSKYNIKIIGEKYLKFMK